MRVFKHSESEEAEIPARLISPEWQLIGFQSKNPRTDFRGGGVLALHCLRYFSLVYPEYFEEMMHDKTDTFFLAISSINISHMLVVYLYMNKADVADHTKKLRAGRKQFKRFARLNSMSKKAFFELHAFLMTYLYKLWLVKSFQTQPRMPNFNDIVDETREEMHEFLKNQRLIDIEALRSIWNEIIAIKFQ